MTKSHLDTALHLLGAQSPGLQICKLIQIKMGTRDRKSRIITVFTGCKYEAEAMLSRLTPDHYQQLPSLVTCPLLTGGPHVTQG